MWCLIKGKQPNSSAKSMRTATTVTPGEGSSCHRFVLIEIWRETWKNYNCFSRLLCLTRHLHWDSGLTHPTNDVFLLHPPPFFPPPSCLYSVKSASVTPVTQTHTQGPLMGSQSRGLAAAWRSTLPPSPIVWFLLSPLTQKHPAVLLIVAQIRD